MLADGGYEVLSATSAEEAVEMLKQAGRTPDVVVSDYRLRDGQVGTGVSGGFARSWAARCRASS